MLGWVSALAMISIAAPAWAQSVEDPRATTAPLSDGTGQGDIIVTAQRRPENLQDVPISLTVAKPDATPTAGEVTLEQIAERTPDFFVTKLGDLRPRLYIRGVGTREYDPGSESSVGVFFDDVYIGRASGVIAALEDIDRIEVLKGPQSTLYGRNSIGGAINIESKAPTETFSVDGRVGYGNFGIHEVFGATSDTLVAGKLLGRFMAYQNQSDGYMTNLSDGRHSTGYDNWGGRGTILATPSNNLRITLIGDLSRRSGPSVDAKSIGSPTDPGGTFFSASTIGVAGAARPIEVADRFADYYNRDSVLRRKGDSLIGRAELDVPGGTVTSITAYRYSHFFETRDFDATSLDAVAQTIAETSRQFSQELRFTSARDGPLSLGSKFRWIAGIYYYHDHTGRDDRFDFGPASISAVRTGSPQNDVFEGDFHTQSWAAFGSATYYLTARLSLTAGVRYTDDQKHLVQTDEASRPGAGFIVVDFTSPRVSRDSDAWTPSASLTYEFSEGLLAYASYNRGYKGGGFQYIPTNVAAAETTFKPERSDAYEAGVKTQFWQKRASINVSAFYYDDYDLQVQRSTTLANGAIAIVTNNADKSTIKGLDADATVEPIPGLSLHAAYSYLDAQYDKYFNNAPGQPLTPATDFSHTPTIRSPKHSFDVGAEYVFRVSPSQSFTPRVDWNYRSKFYFEPGGGNPVYGAAIPLTQQRGYGLVNISIEYMIGRLRVRGFVDNIANRFYLNDVQKLPFNYVVNYPGQPRSYGLSTSYSF